ncbi:ABC transporter permease [Romboutsia lituseburensis]|uniref:ABC transporter permease n=1 Tax=Romboutsia lituseburensis TaxID=1537 RepID=UPI00215A6032|nr:ABC transporter permease [Romboutsia lituseburensis]MCR8744202.1 ABC transporter permease [Romboutsia lituseburensis]
MVIINNAIENIKSNKLRVVVAMIWIVLGITSVIVVSSIGNGIKKQSLDMKLNPQFRTLSYVFYPDYESTISNPAFYEPFTQDDINKISKMEGVERVTPKYGENTSSSIYAQVNSEYDEEFTKINEYKDDTKLDIRYGRKFSLEDLERKTVIIEYDTAWNLFNFHAESAVGKSVNINGETFEVIGVLKKREVDFSDESESYRNPEIYLSKLGIEELTQKVLSDSSITGIEILVLPEYETSEISDQINSMFEKTKDKDFGSYGGDGNGSEQEWSLTVLQGSISQFTSILSKVSLFIGGIGIMNIMYMSVAERKSEIGIRRAIGAEPKDILIQFVIETIVITTLGGIIGMIVGTFAADYASGYIGIKAIPSIGVYLKAFSVSILTGAIFGSIPAIKAAKLDPIKAIQGQ